MVTKFGDSDENGTQRQFNKVSDTANDTAFVTLVIDSRVNNMIYAYCYGAGIHRTINLADKTITYISKEEVETPQPQDDNLVLTSIDSDGNLYNGKGYKEGHRINSSGVDIEASAICCGFIPYNGEEIKVYSSMTNVLTDGANAIPFYDEDFTYIGRITGGDVGQYEGITYEEEENKHCITINPSQVTNSTRKGYIENAKYIRVSMGNCSIADFIVRLNEL